MPRLDHFSGVSPNWDAKAQSVAEFILSQQGTPYTYIQVSQATGLPSAEVSRYLREFCYERRDYDWLLQMRKYNKVAYNHYLSNHVMRTKVDDSGKTIKELYVNFSKRQVFLMNCRLLNLRVEYTTVKGRTLIYLFQNQEDMRTKIYYEVPQTSFESLEHEPMFEDTDATHNSDSEPTVNGESHE